MTGVTAVIYTNFNVTQCDKKCNFFIVLTPGGRKHEHDITIREFRIKCLFLHPIISLYIRINSLFFTFLTDRNIILCIDIVLTQVTTFVLVQLKKSENCIKSGLTHSPCLRVRGVKSRYFSQSPFPLIRGL